MSLIVQEKELCVIEIRYCDHQMVQNGSITRIISIKRWKLQKWIEIGAAKKGKVLERKIKSVYGERQKLIWLS